MKYCYGLKEQFNIEVDCCPDCHEDEFRSDALLMRELKDGTEVEVCGNVANELVKLGLMDKPQLNGFNCKVFKRG